MPFTILGRNAMLDGAGWPPGFISAHTADPGENGASEVSGGSPAYARKAITFAAADGGVKAASNQPVLDIPAGTTVAYLGLWSLATGGVFLGKAQVTAEGALKSSGALCGG
jgi:hypothetical protein